MPHDPIPALMELGFTGLEAEVYSYLATSPPSTGYRIAQALGKPAANVYKAIETLSQKGAVLLDDSDARLCRAIPGKELIARLERQLEERLSVAREALEPLAHVESDDRVYQLRNAAQAIERARQMLARAESVALLDLFPLPLEALRDGLEEAAGRGIAVAMKVYAPVEVPGVRVLIDPAGEHTRSRWPGQWMNLVVDGREHLLALLSADGRDLLQAVWSESVYLSWVYHGALRGELLAALAESMIVQGADAAALRREFEATPRFLSVDAPGYRELLERLGRTNKRGDG